jgi:hypothetical protein
VLAVIDPVCIVPELIVFVLRAPKEAAGAIRVEKTPAEDEIRLAFRLGVLMDAALMRPVVCRVLVRMLLVLVMFPEFRVVNPPITPDKELVRVRLVAKISLQSTMSF